MSRLMDGRTSMHQAHRPLRLSLNPLMQLGHVWVRNLASSDHLWVVCRQCGAALPERGPTLELHDNPNEPPPLWFTKGCSCMACSPCVPMRASVE